VIIILDELVKAAQIRAMATFHGTSRVVSGGMERGTFIQDANEIGTQFLLDVNRFFGGQVVLAAIDVETKSRSIFADFE
jgi:hypothetical protein